MRQDVAGAPVKHRELNCAEKVLDGVKAQEWVTETKTTQVKMTKPDPGVDSSSALGQGGHIFL